MTASTDTPCEPATAPQARVVSAWRKLAGKYGTASLEQIVVAILNFGIVIVSGQLLPAAGFAIFVVVMASMTLAFSLAGAVASGPVLVVYGKRYGEGSGDYLRKLRWLNFVVTLPAGGVCLAVAAYVEPRITVGLAISAFLMLHNWTAYELRRKSAFAMRRTWQSLQCTSAVLAANIFGIGLLWLFGQNNPVAVLIVIGAGYGLGAILFDRITPPPPGDATFSFRGIFVDHWSFSRSLLSGLLLYWAASQGYFMIAARLLPDADLGGARTAQNLAGMITTVLLMFENQATPAAAALAHYGNVGDVRLWVHSLFKKWTLPFIGFVALAAIGAFAVHHILYRNRYADFSYLTFVFALHQLLLGLNRPYAVGLKAIERTTPIFWGHCAGAIVMVVASWTLISSLGALGVAIGFVLSALALLLILHLSFWRLAK